MSTMIVGYDLNKPGKDYDGLIEKLKSFGAWWHHLDSTWLVKTEMSPVELRDALKPYLDSTDELLVIDVSGAARAWVGFSDRASAWLKETF